MHLLKNVFAVALLFPTILPAVINASPILARAPSIPNPPSDPTAPPGDGAGPYKSQKAGWRDYLKKAKFYTIAVAAGELGLNNAERNMRHYLGNSGNDLSISPADIMNSIPKFRDAVKATVQNDAAAAYKRIKTKSGDLAFTGKWTSFYATKGLSLDWYFGLGGFSYSVTGVVTKKASGPGALKYKVHLFDRYNWDEGKQVTIGRFTFTDKELGELHLKGLAREYTVRGATGTNSVDKFTPTKAIPPPGQGGRS